MDKRKKILGIDVDIINKAKEEGHRVIAVRDNVM